MAFVWQPRPTNQQCSYLPLSLEPETPVCTPTGSQPGLVITTPVLHLGSVGKAQQWLANQWPASLTNVYLNHNASIPGSISPVSDTQISFCGISPAWIVLLPGDSLWAKLSPHSGGNLSTLDRQALQMLVDQPTKLILLLSPVVQWSLVFWYQRELVSQRDLLQPPAPTQCVLITGASNYGWGHCAVPYQWGVPDRKIMLLSISMISSWRLFSSPWRNFSGGCVENLP